MADSGIVCSMSRSGNVWDNAAMESFFSSLKTERTARKTYRTRNEARADVFDYIERFYNRASEHPTHSDQLFIRDAIDCDVLNVTNRLAVRFLPTLAAANRASKVGSFQLKQNLAQLLGFRIALGKTLSVNLTQRADQGVSVFAADFAILVAVAIVETCLAHAALSCARRDSILLQGTNGDRRAREITAHVRRHYPGDER
jgi:putative transposase